MHTLLQQFPNPQLQMLLISVITGGGAYSLPSYCVFPAHPHASRAGELLLQRASSSVSHPPLPAHRKGTRASKAAPREPC